MSLRRSVSVLACLVLGATAVPPGAQAAETVSRPASGSLTVDGHGYGHGRGMSQWGAYGAAEAGLSYGDILAFYYPGTRRVTAPASTIRVQISADSDGDTTIAPSAGLSLTSGGRTNVLPTGASYDEWRMVRANRGGTGGLQLQRRDAGAWAAHALPTALGADATFTSSDGLVRLVLPNGDRLHLRRAVSAVSLPAGQVQSVAVLRMEEYLRGVVPAEMPASWTMEALQAQSVAARSYATRLREGATSKLWDTCDTTACQVFKGTARDSATGTRLATSEHSRTDQAIAATAGVILRYGTGSAERTVLTEFSAANGGWTAAGSSAHPYQVAKADPYDGRLRSTANTWTTTVSVASVEAGFAGVGALRTITIDRRDGHGRLGGRVLAATLTGSRGTVTASGDDMRRALGLKSNWFAITGGGTAGFSRDWSGDGVGDVVVIDASARLVLYPGTGSGAFATPRQIGRGWSGHDLVTQVQDWSGDGSNDIVARRPGTAELWLYSGDGRGGFSAARAIGRGWSGVTSLLGAGDWDGDGNADLLAVMDDGTLWNYSGTGTGGFGASRRVASGFAGSALVTAAGDFSGDGLVDLVSRNASGDLLVHRGDGVAGIARSVTIGERWTGVESLRGTGDWDGDGTADLLARTDDGKLALYRGSGSGGFAGAGQVGRGWAGLTLVG